MFGMAGPSEWLVILLVVVLLFGGKKIPELMGGLGKGVKNFKKALNEGEDSNKDETHQIENKSKEGETKA